MTTARITSFVIALGLGALAAMSCDEPAPPAGEGVDLPSTPCGRGVYVAATDDHFQSTSVSIVKWDGTTASAGILTSGSEAPGLSAALSGDVVAPTTRTESGQVVLIDRYPAGVLTFFDPRGPTVTGQLSVQTGFASNPQDYLELGDGRAYVTRYGHNFDPGHEAFDEGNDVLVIDTSAPSIVGRIALDEVLAGEAAGLYAAPNRMVRTAGVVVVLVTTYSPDFKTSGDARLVAIDPETDGIVSVLPLTGLRGCSGLALSPSGTRIAALCSGTFGGSNNPSIDDAGVAIASISGTALAETERLDAPTQPLGQSAAFASEDALLATTLGELDDAGVPLEPDRLVEFDLTSRGVREILSSKAASLALGDVRCEAACGACMVADAGHAAIQRMAIEDGHAGAPTAFAIDDGTGLPPRWLGGY